MGATISGGNTWSGEVWKLAVSAIYVLSVDFDETAPNWILIKSDFSTLHSRWNFKANLSLDDYTLDK
jgi:hypothetical protein